MSSETTDRLPIDPTARDAAGGRPEVRPRRGRDGTAELATADAVALTVAFIVADAVTERVVGIAGAALLAVIIAGWIAVANVSGLYERDHKALIETLTNEVVPLYYDRDSFGLPRGWIGRQKSALRSLPWRFNADRMVRDYVLNSYLPAAGGLVCQMPQ